ncbi:MAG: viroplasmin family protein [Bacilli bacterium]|nr:viroplasmin family protein [Bacilli bacterium]
MAYYAVKVGKKVGVFDNWDECSESTKGFKGAKYKKFSTIEEANIYLTQSDEEQVIATAKELLSLADINDNEIIVYTDGSFNKDYDYVSYGCVCLSKNNPEYRISGVAVDKYDSNQVFGEIKGVLEALDYAIYKGFKKAYVMHDYEGLGKWITKEWRLKSQISMDYNDEIEKRKKSIEIDFIKVAAHTGNKYNEIADKLAKYELKSLEPSKEDDYGFKSYRYSDEIVVTSLNKMKLLIDNFNYTEEEKSNHSIFTCVVGKEKLTFQKYHFDSGNCLIIPKQNEMIFQLLLSFLNDKDTIDTILLNLNCNNNTKIDQNSIKKKLYEIAPALENTKINIDIYRLLVQGIYNLFLEIDYVEDSSYITAPVLRAIEGQLKFVFKNDLNIIVTTGFSYFDYDGTRHFLQKVHAEKIDSSKVDYINKCYNYYNAIRHKIFHFGDLDISDTKTMDNKESKEVIVSSIKLIEEYYK